MSTPLPRDPADPLSLVVIGEQMLNAVSDAARHNIRKRDILRLHEHEDAMQRMVNAVEPESYIRPHRHSTPPKMEMFVVLRGQLLAVRYSDDGTPLQAAVLDESGPTRAVEIPGGAWHSVISLQSGSVALEIIQGPYDATTHKQFAPWAPSEDDADAAKLYLATLRAHLSHSIPELAARDIIAAEEDDAF